MKIAGRLVEINQSFTHLSLKMEDMALLIGHAYQKKLWQE
jgi:hypothetical protein